MEGARSRIAGFYFSRDERTFHIFVRFKDSPGALASILELLQRQVDIIHCVAYQAGNGRAIWSAFVKPTLKDESEAKLKEFIRSSTLVEGCQVYGSTPGLLVDTLHAGLEYGPGRIGILMPSAGFSRICKALVEMFGSGAERILLEEGRALGRASGEYMNQLLGSDDLDWKTNALAGLYKVDWVGNPKPQD